MVSITSLNFGYRHQPLLFKELNLHLHKGHIYGLLGKNGSGKTSLLKNMAGLDFPEKGVCKIHGIPSGGRPVSVLKDLYFLPEEVNTPAQTPRQFLQRTASFYPQFNQTAFFDYLDEFQVDPDLRMDRQSFGNQKKAMISFALATQTSLLILDEPTNGLDIPSKAQFRKLVATVLTEERCIIISTHQVRDLESLIDTLLILQDREIVLNSSLEALSTQLLYASVADTTGMNVLYQEESIRGKSVILKNTNRQFSRVDLELLFNAISCRSAVLELSNELNHG